MRLCILWFLVAGSLMAMNGCGTNRVGCEMDGAPPTWAAPPFARHLVGTSITALTPLSDEAEASDLPDSLVIKPGRYRVYGRVYDMRKEGLYRLMYPPKGDYQRMVFHKDVVAFISALCWIGSHGSRDDRKTFDELLEQAKSGKLIVTCGTISAFSAQLLTRHGVSARTVNSRSLEARNGFDDGHVLMEARIAGRWALFDVDQHRAFLHGGKRLNLLDAVTHIRANTYDLECLSHSMRLAVADFRDETYDYGLWAETMLCTEQALRVWYGRIMRLPILHDKAGSATTCVEADREKMKRVWPDLLWTARDDFRSRFYAAVP